MVVKYLLATLSALANQITLSSSIEISDDCALNKDGINYLNVSPAFGRFLRRRRRMIDLLPKSIIMAISCLVFFVIPFKTFAAAPTTQASNVTVTAFTGTTATFKWANKGNGSNRVAFVYAGSSAGVPAIANGTNFTANTAFLSGTQIAPATGWYCVYNGTGGNNTSVSITNLSPGTTYTIMVVEYNTGPNTYLTTAVATNPVTFTTTPTLSNLVLSTGALTPTFTTNTTTYTQSVTFATSSVTVTPTLSSPGNTGATIKVNGTTVSSGVASGSIALSVGSNTITTVVTSSSGTATDTYTITITRAAPTISYSGSPYTYVNGYAITTLTPTATATPSSYAISPDLGVNTGLTFTTSNGQISGTPTTTNGPTTYTVTATYSDGSTATTTINIQTEASATLTITGNSVSQVYGAVDPTVITSSSYTITGYVNGDNSSSLYLLPSASDTSVHSSSNAGTYQVTVSGASAPAYYTIVYVPGTFTITGAPLTITATGPSETANSTPTPNPTTYTTNFSYSGTVNGETVTGVTIAVSPTTLGAAGTSYTATPSAATGAGGFLASNYTITYKTFTGTCGGNFTWTGSSNSTWSNGANWSGGTAPGTNDIAIIPATSTAPVITATTTINSISFTGNNSITINSGFTLTVNKALSVPSGVSASISLAATTSKLVIGTNTSAANINNAGNFTVTGGTFTVNAGTNYIYNSGVFKVNGGDSFDITGNGSSGNTAIYNAGTFYVGQSGSYCILTFDDSQSIMNLSSGSFYIGPTSVMRYYNTSAHDCVVTNQSGGTFTFQSDATGSACLYASPSTTNSFVGTFTVERYFTAHRGYRLVASPVYSGTSGSNNVYSLNYVQNYALISGTSASGGFDKVSQGPTLYLFREDVPVMNASFIDGNFQSINDLNSGSNTIPTYTFDYTNTTGSYSIPISNAFLFFYRGDRNSSIYSQTQEFTAGNPAEAVTMSTSGSLNTGQVVFRDWYNPSTPGMGWSSSSSATVKGFNLVANPYPCNLDLNTYNTTTTTTGIYGKNISPFFYELNPVTQNFDSYQAVSPYLITNSASRYVMSGQGFFAQATAAGALLNINETAKIAGTGTNFIPQQNTGGNLLMDVSPVPLAVNRQLRIKLSKDSINTDDVVVNFIDGLSDKYDPYKDAFYRQGSGKVSLSIMSSDSVPLAISERALLHQGQLIRLNIGARAEGTYTLAATQITSVPRLFDILLADYDAKDTTDMRKGPYSFNISWADTNSYGSRRFAIITRQNPAYAYQLLDFNAHKVPETHEVQVVWDTKYEENYTNFTVERSTDRGRTFTVLGGVPATGAGQYSFRDQHPEEGLNLYRLKQEDINNKITYSRIVHIGYGHDFDRFAENRINVYPNPAGGRINLAIGSESEKGKSGSYDILITNSSGYMLKRATSNQPDWEGDATGWMPGTYIVKVFDAKTQSLIGTTKFIKL